MFKGIKTSSEPCCLPDYHVQLLFIYQLILQCLVFLHVYIVGIWAWVHLCAYMLLCVYFWIVGMLTFSQCWLLCSFPCDFPFFNHRASLPWSSLLCPYPTPSLGPWLTVVHFPSCFLISLPFHHLKNAGSRLIVGPNWAGGSSGFVSSSGSRPTGHTLGDD